jgi:release factor glutamine methyltransferase
LRAIRLRSWAARRWWKKMMTSNVKDEGKRLKAERSAFIFPPSSFQVLQRAAAVLAASGVDSPRLTAEAVLAHVLGVTRTQLLARPEQTLPAPALAEFRSLVARAAQGEPLAYLTGRREFCGLDFLVDARVLVPRPETELLVELALSHLHTCIPTHILDIGTGSGCIAVTLAVRLPSARVTATDISAAALALARLNAARHGVSDRIDFIQSDLLSACHLPPAACHLLVANLPYIPSDTLPRLPVSRHEPALALDGGPDGLALIRRLLADAPGVMAPHGRLLLEINDAQSADTLALAHAAFPSAQIEMHKDFAGLERVISIAL